MNRKTARKPLPPVSIPSPPATDADEPLTPAGRMFLQPELDTVIHCAIGVRNPLDVDAIKEIIKNSLLLKHPRFSSILVRDEHGRERWRRTKVEIDRHVFAVDAAAGDADDGGGGCPERKVNDYIADLSAGEPLRSDKPLWEIHLLTEERCAVLRIHHALGDGISLMSMLLADCRKSGNPDAIPSLPASEAGRRRRRRSWAAAAAELVMMVVYSLVYCLEFTLRVLCVGDRRTGISGGAGTELWPRKLATAKFLIEDMKTVKSAVANATINDALFGVIASGLSRYLDHRTPNALKEGQQITGMAMVNLRPQSGLQELSDMMKSNSSAKWGNRFGILVLPVFYHSHHSEEGSSSNPLDFVKRAKKMIDRKKKSLEAHFSYKLCNIVMSTLGPKFACKCNYDIICNTSFTISNVLGPKEEITIAGNPVTFLRVNTSSIPHALTMHMVSYAGRADMQILVAKDVIPDPEFLAKCFEDSLMEMKTAAEKAAAASS
ncbi:unnamed protein product [Linum tenue]|uniref:Diacylglycerol O-acyltransferase n=1 Tax=Linum tenue TaxID=586396 RepID=A0AAV0RGX0_9ROSI|nr:unnamed protein product [Linum tenue]